MDFLKNIGKALFGGGRPSGNRGYYVYVRPKRCDEIVQVRIDLMNSLSLQDDGKGYFVRKMASATRCPFQAEFTLYFDKGKRLVDRTIENGEFVTEEDYDEYMASKAPKDI